MTTRLERRQQELQVLELRRHGGSLVAIGASLGISPSTVQRRLRAALDALGAETSDELRRQAEDRLSDVLQRCYALLEPGVLHSKDVPKVLGLIRQTTKDLAWLLGTNVPPTVILRNEGLDV